MTKPKDPQWLRVSEYDRLATIAVYDLLNPDLRHGLNEISESSARELGHPSSTVTVVLDSAQFFVGSFGLTGWVGYAEGTPIEWAFCAHVVASGEPYLVSDASKDPVHWDSPLVIEGQRSYAGVPLTTPEGYVIGAHCVLDSRPRTFDDNNVTFLLRQAERSMKLLEEYRRPSLGKPVR